MKTQKNKMLNIIGVPLLGLVVIAGTISTIYIGKKIEVDERHNLLLRAKTLATSIDPENIKNLKGNLEDLENPFYKKTKQIITNVHKVNTDTRFVYIMGLHGDQQFFFVDSEDPSSKDYSYPGQPYLDADSVDIFNHRNGIAYTKGPYTDSWGNWFSAHAPIIDQNGSIVGLVGMDIHSEDVLLRIAIVKRATIIISGLVFLSILLLLLFAHRKK